MPLRKMVAAWRTWVSTNGNVFLVATVGAAALWVAMNWGEETGPTMLDTAVMALLTAWITSKGMAVKKRSEVQEVRQAATEAKVEQLQQVAEEHHGD